MQVATLGFSCLWQNSKLKMWHNHIKNIVIVTCPLVLVHVPLSILNKQSKFEVNTPFMDRDMIKYQKFYQGCTLKKNPVEKVTIHADREITDGMITEYNKHIIK